jgi:hypothetical protein
MMRAILPHPLAERRPSRRRRHKRPAASAHGHALDVTPSLTVQPDEVTAVANLDLAVQRVRAAGGPIDEASYTCSCGYVFLASVSTTVACPHCGTSQAW